MWESPIYKLQAQIQGKPKDVYIDVTGSAPNFSEPMKQLEGTFEVLFKDLDPKKTKVLDFGAGKLRNTLYLLKKGFTVYTCEFKDLFDRSQQAKDFHDVCRKFNNFKPLIFPDDFIKFDEKFDVIILINVLNIMPVPIERLCVLTLCRKKINNDGRLLWYTQHGGYDKENAVGELYDGLVTGKGRKYNMFYRDFSRTEIHRMLESTGFIFNKDFKFTKSGSNQSYAFNPSGEILVDKSLGLTSLLQKSDESKLKKVERATRWEVDSDDKKSTKVKYETKVPKRRQKIGETNILESYLNELDRIRPGKKGAHHYHRLIFNILKAIFEDKLKRPRMEEPIADKTQRVDITFQNQRENGFFKQLAEGYQIICPNIFMECKNYKEDLKNNEFFQMRCRLNKIRGQFGILICRKIENQERVKKAQDDAIKKGEYFIVLEDNDIKKLAKFKIEKDENKIDDFIEDKFKNLT